MVEKTVTTPEQMIERLRNMAKRHCMTNEMPAEDHICMIAADFIIAHSTQNSTVSGTPAAATGERMDGQNSTAEGVPVSAKQEATPRVEPDCQKRAEEIAEAVLDCVSFKTEKGGRWNAEKATSIIAAALAEQSPMEGSLIKLVDWQVEQVCDAFGKGFDQAERNLPNPYVKESALHYAYEYGKETSLEQPSTPEEKQP